MKRLYKCYCKYMKFFETRKSFPFTLLSKPTIYRETHITMEYKRQYRDLPDEVKQKISASTKGKAKTYDHKLHISQGMKKYWQSVPNRPTAEGEIQ